MKTQLLYKGNRTYSIFDAENAIIYQIRGKRFQHFKNEEMFEDLEIVTNKGTFLITGCNSCHGIDIDLLDIKPSDEQ